MYECRCDERLGLFIIRVKRELKRVYRNGCRYNERLNVETGGSKTHRIHWVGRGTGTPKDRDEVNRREVCECDR